LHSGAIVTATVNVSGIGRGRGRGKIVIAIETEEIGMGIAGEEASHGVGRTRRPHLRRAMWQREMRLPGKSR
jgi:hypothetical protein